MTAFIKNKVCGTHDEHYHPAFSTMADDIKSKLASPKRKSTGTDTLGMTKLCAESYVV